MKKKYAKASVLCCLITPVVTWAEHSPEATEDVLIVTANKRAEALNKVNGSILVKTGEELEQAGITQVQDLERAFPGLQIRSRGNRTYSATTIRGISSPDYYSPSIRIYVDGVPQDHQFLTQELINVERVELLRGPQGTLYGGNAQAGVINIITRSPKEGPWLNLSGHYSKLKQGGSFSGSIPLIEDMLYGSMSLRWVKEPGQIDAPNRGDKNIDSSKTWLGKGKLTFAPEESPFSAELSFAHEDLNSHEELYLTDEQFRRKEYDGLIPDVTRRVNSYALKAEYDFGNNVLTSITAYQDRDISRDFIGGKWKEKHHATTQELRLNSNYSNGITSVLGGWFSDETSRHHTGAYMNYYSAALNTIKTKSLALFGEVKLPIASQWDLTLGGRLSHEKSQIAYAGRSGMMAVDAFDNQVSSNEFIPKAALGWQLTPDTRFYLSATKGYKPGGFNNIVSSANDKKPYDTETSDNYEFGWHTSFFNDAMTLNSAVYYIRSKDKQIYVGPMGGQFIRNAGKAESKGIELSSQIKPIQGLRLSLGGSVGKSNFTETTSGVNYKGKRLPYAPDVMLNASFDYLIDQTLLPGNLYFNAGTRYYSKSYFDEANTLEQGGYTLYDASLSLEMDHGINVKLYGENLGNKQYRVSSFQMGNNTYSMINKGLNVGLDVSIAL
ncbi:TonB-dependent receptor [Xenorhabdus griffiniae]|uniref:TonB-dependent receptor n=1 Tax=Xenorhabdus griffiniae TaxID=351672 RepID=A0ABY9XMT6_9GAMM|nr:TonB-dependent receptor [Xenorhabdus griffiniae]MBD1227465.1 TonB-dependent receptor [Xenorhabdus griffiniae]MBE8586115.1 TonB-dependent receptor [Xenorhabdus griffiniae]WMV74218.1 TonB-dependent receptor [Xenorhabdus griffiniae]WNH03898.1 TonB-dependent receptor [Xenorhabdus griffiniae]